MLRRISSVLVVLAIAALVLETAGVAQGALVGYWTLDDASGASGSTIVDSSGNGNNGTVVGTLTPSVSGTIGTAFTFPGGNNYISVPHVAALSGMTNMTLCAWFTWNSGTSGSRDIFRQWSDGGANSDIMGFLNSGNDFAGFGMETTNLRQATTPKSGLTANTWYQATFVYCGNNGSGGSYWNLYMNGTFIQGISSPASGTAVLGADTSALKLGGGDSGWAGKLDDLAILNEALSDGEIKSLYNVTQVAALSTTYGVGNMYKLFTTYTTSAPTTLGSLTWNKVTGLSGHNAGDVWTDGSAYYVQLDSTGGGVATGTIPEPGTLALLAAGLAGLLCYAWRKRR